MTHTIISIEGEPLIPPCGSKLKNLVVEPGEADELRTYAKSLPSIRLSPRATCDLELLAIGAFSPLDRFMGSADYARVLDEMRLADGHLFPVPVTLPVDGGTSINAGRDIALCDPKNDPIAVMQVEEIFPWSRSEYARKVLETESIRHPIVTELGSWEDRFISGPLRVIRLPRHYDFPELRLTPAEVRSRLMALGGPNVVAFQTRNVLHRAHEEMTKRAIEKTGGVLLLHPVVGLTKPGDVDHYSRVRTYKLTVEKYYDPNRTLLSLLPLAMRFAGPREALWHALIRRNYGASHFIVGRDHASPGLDEHGKPFHEPNAARELAERHSLELGVRIVPFEEFVYLPETERYVERSELSGDQKFFALSGTSAREDYLNKGRSLPDWFVRRDVAQILEESFPPRYRQGVCVWFTGLSGSGKSTTAEILTSMLARYGRRVTLLDGDVIRTTLSAGLGFDREGRDANIRRIGFVASEIVRHGGIAICAAISPFRETRNEVRKAIGENFVEVFVNTPLDVCEQRDPKGMYAKARMGRITNFTGVDDVYEPPRNSEIVLDTIVRTAEENASSIIKFLLAREFIREDTQIEP